MRFLLSIIFISSFVLLSGQKIAPDIYWIYFTDKDNNDYEISEPEAFMSQRSIDRRGWQGLPFDATDLPVSARYIDSLNNLGVDVIHLSKWLNGAAIRSDNPDILSSLYAKPFIDSIQWKITDDSNFHPSAPAYSRFEPPLSEDPDFYYGYSEEQIEQINLHALHKKGYTGKGVYIAVLDAGFKKVDSLPAFEKMIEEGRIVDKKNFVNDEDIFRLTSEHGMNVLSILGGEWDDMIMGSAPHANYMLCTTENSKSEYRVEEIAWIAAAELADSMGFDLFNTSLGYSEFNDSLMDYTYADMDGYTAFISHASSMLAGKGIISVSSAGNSGNDDWYYITAPADAENIIAVGAVDSMGFIARFSSRGPAYDYRLKPEVVGMGRATAVQHSNGNPARGNGTSFSSPVIAGAVAVLWQAYPDIPAKELIRLVLNSADMQMNPDATYGYGIPDFASAFYGVSSLPAFADPRELDIYPNPASSKIMIRVPEQDPGHSLLEYYDMHGRLLWSHYVDLPGEIILPSELHQGIYILLLKSDHGIYRNMLIIE